MSKGNWLAAVISTETQTVPFNLERLTFFAAARSRVKLSSESPGEKSWPGELQSEGECMVTLDTRFGVLLATCLAGGGRSSTERIFISRTKS